MLAALTAVSACALAFTVMTAFWPTVAWIAMGISAFLFTRPNTVGEAFGFIGIAGWIAVATSSARWRTERVSVRFLGFAVALLGLYWFYVIALDQYRTLAPTSGNLSGLAIPSFIAGVGALVGGWAIARDQHRSDLFMKTLVALCAWQIAAYAVMLPLWRAFGSGAGAVAVGNLAAFGGREQTFTVWISGTITTGSGGFGENLLGPRLTGWAGEPGVFAATLVVLCLQTGLPRPWRVLALGSAVLGVFFTQSTAGLLSGAIALLVWLLLRATRPLTRIVSALGVITLGTAAFSWLLSSQFGLKGKGESNSISVDDRLGGAASVPDLIQAWVAHPLGDPFARGGSVGVNLIQESLRYGLVIALLTSAVLLVPAMTVGALRRAAPGLAALLTTIWFAQPGMTNPLWLMLLALIVGRSASERDPPIGEIQSEPAPSRWLADVGSGEKVQ